MTLPLTLQNTGPIDRSLGALYGWTLGTALAASTTSRESRMFSPITGPITLVTDPAAEELTYEPLTDSLPRCTAITPDDPGLTALRPDVPHPTPWTTALSIGLAVQSEQADTLKNLARTAIRANDPSLAPSEFTAAMTLASIISAAIDDIATPHLWAMAIEAARSCDTTLVGDGERLAHQLHDMARTLQANDWRPYGQNARLTSTPAWTPLTALPVALAFATTYHNPWIAIRRVTELPGDLSLLAPLTGAICGARWGMSSFPEDIISDAERSMIGPDLTSVTAELAEARLAAA